MRNQKEHFLRKRPKLEGVKERGHSGCPCVHGRGSGESGPLELDPSCVPGRGLGRVSAAAGTGGHVTAERHQVFPGSEGVCSTSGGSW